MDVELKIRTVQVKDIVSRDLCYSLVLRSNLLRNGTRLKIQSTRSIIFALFKKRNSKQNISGYVKWKSMKVL